MNRTPIEFWCWSCFARERGLVNGSATFRSVCTLQISMSPSWTFSIMELKQRLMSLVFLWNLGSLARAIAPVLSQKRVIGPDALGITQICVEASIDVTLYNELLVTSIYEKHVLNPFQVLQDILDRWPVFRAGITLVPSYQTYGKVYIRSGTQHAYIIDPMAEA